ncbi:Alkaline phosphatase-like alpha/beta/alpha [Penicillium capsulatum]|uniref:Alkaline phosphatase-like alpha/beta/alpha n=1 Tax=Penicillium capsulatum TaxID=69766 RepID=A0A9W9LZK6_9EURO|nr:Alkaline phosphatase-like alpha/beta/alpha [Penicillium capsulatum]KAJ6130317.1 Alkaline phosphatase-like alpha/beta/alpha [Penicillium capsulatum]
MKLPDPLVERFWAAAFFALAVIRSPQPYIDHIWATTHVYFFSVNFIALVASKCFHIFVHFKSLSLASFLAWGPTFFLPEIIFILLFCGLARWFEWRILRNIATFVPIAFGVGLSCMTSANFSFYVNIGMEIHWRGMKKFHESKPTAKLVLSALSVSFLAQGWILLTAYFARSYLLNFTQAFLDIWVSLVPAKIRCCARRDEPLPDPEVYEQIAIDDFDDDQSGQESGALLDSPREKSAPKSRSWLVRIIAIVGSVGLIALRLVRPNDMAYAFFSESLPLAPFGGPQYRPAAGTAALVSGEFSWLDGHTALDAFPKFDWLPRNASGAFPEWSPFRVSKTTHEHYNPRNDPLHTPNLQNDVLEPMRAAFSTGDVKIKHIVLIYLESTRQDVWPFRADSYIMKHIRESFDGKIPAEVEEKLSKLTPTAQRLTGIATGFENAEEPPAPIGGISVSQGHTSGTYTLKSMTGTLCGVNPMAVEANLEYKHDIYQPCLPHILEALNSQPNITSDTNDWTLWPWYTTWQQSHSSVWDHHGDLVPRLGYKHILDRDVMAEQGDKYIPEESEEEYKHRHEDKVMKNYFLDLISDAKTNNTRLFLSHLTHNTHTPWFKPGEYEDLFGNEDGLNYKMNRYLNTIHYQDEWIGDILGLLEETGIADETLVVMAGDHGLSLPNDGGITANHSPHIGNFHVPMILSHPKLPPIDVSSPVLATQILPTILDLLLETNSLDEQSARIIGDLLPLYEGQTMLRPLIPEWDGRHEWQFNTMNPGGTWISMRAPAQPYRLVVPLVPDAPWRFTNPTADPFELEPQEDLDIVALMDTVQTTHGPDAGKWLTEAAHVGQWWIAENHRRWKYNPDVEQ